MEERSKLWPAVRGALGCMGVLAGGAALVQVLAGASPRQTVAYALGVPVLVVALLGGSLLVMRLTWLLASAGGEAARRLYARLDERLYRPPTDGLERVRRIDPFSMETVYELGHEHLRVRSRPAPLNCAALLALGLVVPGLLLVAHRLREELGMGGFELVPRELDPAALAKAGFVACGAGALAFVCLLGALAVLGRFELLLERSGPLRVTQARWLSRSSHELPRERVVGLVLRPDEGIGPVIEVEVRGDPLPFQLPVAESPDPTADVERASAHLLQLLAREPAEPGERAGE